MPNLIVCNEAFEVLYTSDLHDREKILHGIHDKINHGFPSQLVRVNGLIVIVSSQQRKEHIRPILSARQAEVLQCLAQSMTSGQIAIKIGISKSTVHMHLRVLKKKFGAESKEQLMAMAGSLGLCDPFKGK